jgi:hypothetical protein
MAFFGALPLASLLVQGIPLGVAAWLYSQGKTGTNGSSQMAASGVQLELSQALKAEYAAFAAADMAVIAKALNDEMETWKNELPKKEDPTLGSRALGALGFGLALPFTAPVAGVAYGVRKLGQSNILGALTPTNTAASQGAPPVAADPAKPRPGFFDYFRKNARADANKTPKTADTEDGNDTSDISAASTVDTISKEDAIKQFEEILRSAGGKDGNTKRLLYVIKNHPSIVTQPFGGKSALQLVIAAAIADAEGTPLNPGFFGRLAAAAAPAVSAIGRAGQIAAAAAAAANETLNPVAIANRRAREAEVLNDIYEPAPEDEEVDDEDETMAGGATMNEWAAVVTQILRTPYIYEDASLEDAVTALNDRIKKEAKYNTARKKELAAQARSPKVVLTKKKNDAEFELRKALDVLTDADGDAAKEDARLTVEVARARLSDANTALLEAKEDTETFNADAESVEKAAAAKAAVEARQLLLTAKDAASISRKATPRPMAAFNDLIAMHGVKPENRKQTAKSLVPVLKAFMWWRWNVIHYPLSYTTEQVVDAQHLLDGMTARTQPIAPFFNASVTLRRNINEKRGLKPTPEEVEAAAAEKAAVALAEKVAVEVAAQQAEREAAEAKRVKEEEEQEQAEAEAEEAAREESVRAAAAKAAEAGPVGSLRGSDADLAVPEFGIEMPEVRRSVLPSPVAIAPPIPPSNAVAIMRSSDPRGHTPFGSQIQGLPQPAAPAAPLVFAPPPVPPSNAAAVMRSSDPRGHTPFKFQVPLPQPAALAAPLAFAPPPAAPPEVGTRFTMSKLPGLPATPPAPAAARAARAARVAKATRASAPAAGGKRRRGTPKRRRTRKSRNSTFRRHRKH